MSPALILVFLSVAVLLLLLAWALRSSDRTARSGETPSAFEDIGRAQIEFLPQIRQALAPDDDEFLAQTGFRQLQRRVRRERRRVALRYLMAIRQDFEGLLRTARVIATLSPDIGVGQEFERLSLTFKFLWRYRMIQMALYMGLAPQPEVDALSNMISGLSVRLEAAVKAMGERAALAAEMLSPPDRGRIHLA